MVTIGYLRELLHKLESFCCKEERLRGYDRDEERNQNYGIGLEIFEGVLDKYETEIQKELNKNLKEIESEKVYVIDSKIFFKDRNKDDLSHCFFINKDDLIKKVGQWRLKIQQGTPVSSLYGTLSSHKSTLNNILSAMWYKGRNDKNIGLSNRQSESFIYFVYNSFKKEEAEKKYLELTRKEPRKTNTKTSRKKDRRPGSVSYQQTDKNVISDKLNCYINSLVKTINKYNLLFYIHLNCTKNINIQISADCLEDEVNMFLSDNKNTLLILGDSGSGKSTFCMYLLRQLVINYQEDSNKPLPVYIRLGESWVWQALSHCRLIEEYFLRLGFSNNEIRYLSDNKHFIFILDSYDELGRKRKIIQTNKLDNWNAKIIITCRTQYLGKKKEHLDLFSLPNFTSQLPRPENYAELYIVPFSEENIEEYILRYINYLPLEKQRNTNLKFFKDKINNIYNLKELVSNPLLLSIITKTLPESKVRNTFNKSELYKEFFEQWFEIQKSKSNDFFEDIFFTFAQELAFQMFLHDKIEIKYSRKSEIENKIKNCFSDSGARESEFIINFFKNNDPDFKRARVGCPIQRSADNTYKFMHHSFQEYCIARKLSEEINENNINSLNKILLTENLEILGFLAEMKISEENLLEVIEKSKKRKSIKIASANAATILNKKKYPFSGLNFVGIQIPKADLSNAILDNTNLSGANLKGVNLRNAFLRKTNFSNSFMSEIDFGEKPHIECGNIGIDSVCFSPNGNTIASGNLDNTIIIWEVNSGKAISIFKEHKARVKSVCFNANGTLLASGGFDKTVRLWNVAEKKIFATLEGHNDRVESVSFNHDGTIVASASWDKTICLWDVANKKLIKTLKGHDDRVQSVNYSRDGNLIASGDLNNTVCIWRDDNDYPIYTLKNHECQVKSVCFNHDGSMLASASMDGMIILWDTLTGKRIGLLKCNEFLTSISFNHNGSILASGNLNGTIILWHVASRKPFSTIKGHESGINEIAFNKKGTLIASGSWDKTIRLWNVAGKISFSNLYGHDSMVKKVCINKNETIIASMSSNDIYLWDIESKSIINTLKDDNQCELSSVCFDYSGKAMAYSDSGSIRKVCLDSGKQLYKIEPSQKNPDHFGIRCICINPKETILASCGDDNMIHLWDINSGELLFSLIGHKRWVVDICFSSDGSKLASGSIDKTICLWDIETRKIHAILDDHKEQVIKICFNHDGTRLASGCIDNNIYIWDLLTGHIIAKLEGHKGFVESICFNHNGTLLASGSKDRTIRIWDVNNKKTIDILEGHSGWVNSLCFNADSSILISGGDTSVKIWEMKTKTVRWATNSKLFCKGININNVRGLSENNRRLLKQYSAYTPLRFFEKIPIGSPITFSGKIYDSQNE